MAQLREYFERNRRIALPVLAVVVALVVYWAISRSLGGGPAEAPAPPAPAATAPAPVAPPEAEQPAPAPESPGGVVLAGRSDPFVPLVTEPRSAPPGPAAGGRTPLPPPLPLPPLPPVPGAAPGVPGAPGAPQAQPAPPAPEAGITVLGIISDTRSLVIISISGKTEILFEGEAVGDLRVVKIDPVRGVVTFSRAGKQFELKIGGG